jgi:transcriptional regulator GlxA family with amidase domain
MAWVKESAKDAEVVLSVCNGAFFLAKAGLLDAQRSGPAAPHPGDHRRLGEAVGRHH